MPRTFILLRPNLGELQIGIRAKVRAKVIENQSCRISEDSTVTYTEVSSPFEDLSDIGSPGVVGPEYEGLPWMLDDPYVQVVLQAPPSPDYMPGPEEPEQAPPLPDFVPEPVYPSFMPPRIGIYSAEEPATACCCLPMLIITQAMFPSLIPRG
ncbi:hypothetical protein Tco_0328959 [Tanacetum coccineum]